MARKKLRARRVWRSRGPESRAPSSRRAPRERRASPSSLPSFRRACARGGSRNEGQGGKRPDARRLADQAGRDEFKATSRGALVDEETHAAFAEGALERIGVAAVGDRLKLMAAARAFADATREEEEEEEEE